MLDVNQEYTLLLYHGTSDVYSNEIQKYGFKIIKNRSDHWLGHGVYFYREDPDQAMTWALHRYKNETEVKAAHVLHTTVCIRGTNFLNLDTRWGMKIFSRFIEQTKEKLGGIKFKARSPAALRHFIMEQLSDEYLVIQRTFTVDSVYDGIEELKKMELRLMGTQVCVRRLKAIQGEVRLFKTQDTPKAFA